MPCTNQLACNGDLAAFSLKAVYLYDIIGAIIIGKHPVCALTVSAVSEIIHNIILDNRLCSAIIDVEFRMVCINRDVFLCDSGLNNPVQINRIRDNEDLTCNDAPAIFASLQGLGVG